jgi:formamidopyrimidine-DNA glycosylase
MPELPEVEFARRCWERWAGGRTVLGLAAAHSRILRPRGPRALQALKGATFQLFQRRGKNLLFTARRAGGPVGVWSHLGMTGKWVRRPSAAEAPRFSRVRIDLDDEHAMHYCDMRLFGRLQLVPGARFEALPEVEALGPDPIGDGIDVARLAAKLAATRLPVKVALLDQRLLAGIGNIQASESLLRAGIDPRRPARALSPAEVKRLAGAIRRSLDATLRQFEDAAGEDCEISYVEEPGTPNPFLIYDRAGERCRRCRKGTIARLVQAGRSTFYCDRCQK